MASLGTPDDMGGMELKAAMASLSVACQRTTMRGDCRMSNDKNEVRAALRVWGSDVQRRWSGSQALREQATPIESDDAASEV